MAGDAGALVGLFAVGHLRRRRRGDRGLRRAGRQILQIRGNRPLIFEVELTTTSDISGPAWLRPLRPLCRYSAMSSTLQDFRPLRSAPSSRGANMPATCPPPNGWPRLSAPKMFFGVWQAPQWLAPSTR